MDHNAAVCGVTITNQDLDKDALIMDALGYYGENLNGIYWPDYTETYWRNADADINIMQNYVVGHGQYDIAPIMSNVKASFFQPMSYVYNAIFGSNSDFPSVVKATSDKINADVQAYFAAGAPLGLGDVNADGRIDTTDARLVLQQIVGKTDLTNWNNTAMHDADVNQDGRIDTVDARLILQYIVGKIDTF